MPWFWIEYWYISIQRLQKVKRDWWLGSVVDGGGWLAIWSIDFWFAKSVNVSPRQSIFEAEIETTTISWWDHDSNGLRDDLKKKFLIGSRGNGDISFIHHHNHPILNSLYTFGVWGLIRYVFDRTMWRVWMVMGCARGGVTKGGCTRRQIQVVIYWPEPVRRSSTRLRIPWTRVSSCASSSLDCMMEHATTGRVTPHARPSAARDGT